MTVSSRQFVLFVLAVVVANVVTILATAAVFKAAPGLRRHHPGF